MLVFNNNFFHWPFNRQSYIYVRKDPRVNAFYSSVIWPLDCFGAFYMTLLLCLCFRVDLSNSLYQIYRFLSFKIPLFVICWALRNSSGCGSFQLTLNRNQYLQFWRWMFEGRKTSTSDSQWRLTCGEEVVLGAECPFRVEIRNNSVKY